MIARGQKSSAAVARGVFSRLGAGRLPLGRGAAAFAVSLLLIAAAVPAGAVEAPRWVAALFVEAQRSVGLRWTPVPGASGYKVLRSETKGAGYQEIAATAQPQHFDPKVEPGTTYYYVLQAVAGAEVSPNSDEKAILIPGQKKKALAVPAWTNVVVQETTEFGKTSYKAGLFWGVVQGAVAYNVYKSLEPGKNYQLLASVSESQSVDAAIEVGKAYYYVVSALDSSFQETPYSAERKIVVEKKKEVVAKKAKVNLELKPRTAKPLWVKAEGDDQGRFRFKEPYGMAERDGYLYAVSNSTQEVFVLDGETGEFVRTIGEKGPDPGQLFDPTGVALDDRDQVYVADRAKKKIMVYSNEGSFVKEIALVPPKEAEGVEPALADIKISPKTGEIFVADTNIKRVWVLDDAGKFDRFIGEPGNIGDVDKLNNPTWLDFDPAGNLVVIDNGSTRIVSYRTDGTFLRSWGERKPAVGAFLFIAGSAFDAEGNILVVEMSASMVQGFLPDGRYLYHLSTEDGKKADLYAPKKIVASSKKKNRIYIAQGLANRISAFDLTGPVPPPQEEAESQEQQAK